jgi:hypothetical protein
MSNTEGMWEEPIAGIKIGGINGVGFNKGRPFGKETPMHPILPWVTEIRREIDEFDCEVFLVFAKRDNKGEIRLLKVSKGEPVYVTFDVFSD